MKKKGLKGENQDWKYWYELVAEQNPTAARIREMISQLKQSDLFASLKVWAISIFLPCATVHESQSQEKNISLTNLILPSFHAGKRGLGFSLQLVCTHLKKAKELKLLWKQMLAATVKVGTRKWSISTKALNCILHHRGGGFRDVNKYMYLYRTKDYSEQNLFLRMCWTSFCSILSLLMFEKAYCGPLDWVYGSRKHWNLLKYFLILGLLEIVSTLYVMSSYTISSFILPPIAHQIELCLVAEWARYTNAFYWLIGQVLIASFSRIDFTGSEFFKGN